MKPKHTWILVSIVLLAVVAGLFLAQGTVASQPPESMLAEPESGAAQMAVAASGWSSGWVPINQGETITLAHNLGGDVEDYAVELWFRDTDAGGIGINTFAYGGFENDGDGTLGGDFIVSTPKPEQGASAIAYNSLDDEYLVVWGDERGGSEGIYGQIYSAQGLPLRENLIVSAGASRERSPTVVHNHFDNEYLVVWEKSPNGVGVDLYGQRLDPDGNLLGDPFAITTPGQLSTYPALAYNSTLHQYLVVWEDNRDYGATSWDIYGQRLDGDGDLLGDELAITTADDDQHFADLAYNAISHQYLVVWQHTFFGETDIAGQLVAADGSLVGNQWGIELAADNQYSPAVAWNSVRNEYLVVWHDEHFGPKTNIVGQIFWADGTIHQDRVFVSSGWGYDGQPDVVHDPTLDQYLVVWQDGRNSSTSDKDIYGQRVLGDGRLAGQGNFAISQAAHTQGTPAVAYNSTSHQFLVTWHDRRNGDSLQIYGQRVWWPGLLLGHNFAIGAPLGTQEEPVVAYNRDEHQYLVVWADERDGDFDIYGQLYSQDGQPLGDNLAIVTSPSDQTHPGLAYNAASDEYLVVWEDAILGVYGQRLRSQGTPVGAAFPLFADTAVRGDPVVVGDAINDQYLVAYTHGGPGARQVRGTLVAGDGRLLRSDLPISTDTSNRGQIDVDYNPIDDQYFVVWHDERNDEGDIYGRLLESDGEMPHSKFVVSVAADSQDHPAVAWNRDDDEYLIVWHDYRDSGVTGADIYAQRIEATGSSAGGNFRVSTSAGLYNEQVPDVAYVNTLNRYRVIWQDDREAALGWDIRGQWVAADGTVIGLFDDPVFRYSGWQQNPAIAYARSDDQALAVWQDGRNSLDYDVYGCFGVIDVTPPEAHFTRDPTFGRAGDVFTFNAWPSRDDSSPRGALMVRWDWTSDGTWNTPLSFDKYITRTINNPGVYTVTLGVWDLAWFSDTLSHRVVVISTTLSPPTATLTISPTFGRVGDRFTFDSGDSGGGKALVNGLTVRWDWENDGEFDTSFGVTQTAVHSYTVAGDYTIRVEVLGANGLSKSALRNVTVLPGDVITLEVRPASATMAPGEAVQFHATAWDEYDNEMSNPGVVWSVTNSLAGTIDADGVFTASTRAGTYPDVILAASGSVTDAASVTIVWPYQIYLPLVLRND